MASTTALTQKTKDAVNQASGFVKKNPMIPVYVIGGGFVLYLLYKLATTTSNAVDGLSDIITTDKDAGGGAVIIDNPTVKPIGASINRAQAQNLAATLLSSFHTWGGVSSKEFEKVKSVFRGKNAKDYALISEAFGEPRRNIITGEAGVLLSGSFKMNLSQWIAKELTNAQRLELKQISTGIF